MRKYLRLHILIISFVFFLTPTIQVASDVEEEIESCKQAIGDNPDDAKAHYNLGYAYGESGMHKEAIEAYKQAIRIDPDLADAHTSLGYAYGKSGMDKEAIEAYKQVIRIDPDNVYAHFNLGYAYKRSSMYKEEIEAYKQVIRINPDYAEAHFSLGYAYGKSGMNKEAIEAYKQVIRIDPDEVYAHSILGNAYIKSFKYKEAIEACKQAIKIKPDYADAHFSLGYAYAFLNDRDSALKQYKILKSLDSEQANELFNVISETSEMERLTTESYKIIEKSIGSQYRGKVADATELMLQRKYDEARKLVDNVIKEFETKYLKNDISYVSVASKDEYMEFIKAKGAVGVTWIDWSYSQSYFIKAFIASELHELEEALTLIDKVIELSPFNSSAHCEKGNILNLLQKPNEAILEYQTAFNFSERFATQSSSKVIALRGMGYSYIELGELSNAKQMYEKSLKIDDNSDIAKQELEHIKHLLIKSINK